MTPPIDPEDDATLVRKARWGDRPAFDALYRRHAPAVYTLAYRLTGSHAAAEDIAQDTFLRMLQFLGGFRDGAPLRPWLKRVASNAAIDRLRRERTRAQVELDEGVVAAPADPAPDAAVANDLLRRLAPLPRALVWLHTMEGWTHAELGARFGQSPSWSKSIVSRALGRLRDAIAEEEEAP